MLSFSDHGGQKVLFRNLHYFQDAFVASRSGCGTCSLLSLYSQAASKMGITEADMKAKLDSTKLRKAILVPDSRLALLSRIAFGADDGGEYRVFYNDMAQAIMWLEDRDFAEAARGPH